MSPSAPSWGSPSGRKKRGGLPSRFLMQSPLAGPRGGTGDGKVDCQNKSLRGAGRGKGKAGDDPKVNDRTWNDVPSTEFRRRKPGGLAKEFFPLGKETDGRPTSSTGNFLRARGRVYRKRAYSAPEGPGGETSNQVKNLPVRGSSGGPSSSGPGGTLRQITKTAGGRSAHPVKTNRAPFFVLNPTWPPSPPHTRWPHLDRPKAFHLRHGRDLRSAHPGRAARPRWAEGRGTSKPRRAALTRAKTGTERPGLLWTENSSIHLAPLPASAVE